MEKRQRTVTEREISRRRSMLLLKCLIAVLIFVSVGMLIWLIYDTQFKEHGNPWTKAGKELPAVEAGGNLSASQGSSDGNQEPSGSGNPAEPDAAAATGGENYKGGEKNCVGSRTCFSTRWFMIPPGHLTVTHLKRVTIRS